MLCLTAPTTLLYPSIAVRMYVAHSGLPHCSASICGIALLVASVGWLIFWNHALVEFMGALQNLTNPSVTTITGAVNIADAIAPAYLNWSAV